MTAHETIPTHTATAERGLSGPMLADYRSAGVLVIEDFVPVDACRRLRERALQLVDEFDPETVRHVFSTTKQTQLDDSYFYESGDKIRFFLEDDAFDESGQLRQSKHDSLNKMGHAMHDLDPVFNAFSRTPELAAVTRSLGARHHPVDVHFQAAQDRR
jgi:phytanoyl-CoA hydroxylase